MDSAGSTQKGAASAVRPEWVRSTKTDVPSTRPVQRRSPAPAWTSVTPAKPKPAPSRQDSESEGTERRAEAAEEAARDQSEYAALLGVLHILRDPGVAAYTGLTFPFSGPGTPEPQKGCTTSGIILDLSRGPSQRLITRWGVMPLSYALTFEGYQSAEATHDPLPSENEADIANEIYVRRERTSLFFTLCDSPAPALLKLVKLKGARFRVESSYLMQDSADEVKMISPSAQQVAVLRERWTRLANSALQPKAAERLQTALPTRMTPVLNVLLGRVEAVRCELLPALKRQKVVAAARIPPSEGDLLRAMRVANNEIEAAATVLRDMRRAEDALVSHRGGHSTRSMVRAALVACDYDEEGAKFLLDQKRAVARNADAILKLQGLETGIGWPTREEVEARLAMARNDESHVLSALKQARQAELQMMAEILHTAMVDELFSPDNAELYGLSTPPSDAERLHIEDLFVQKFNKDMSKTHAFLASIGALLARFDELTEEAWQPSRAELETLVTEFGAARAEAYLVTVKRLLHEAPKCGSPDVATCQRYARLLDCDDDAAVAFAQAVWKLIDTKPKKVPRASAKSASVTRQGTPNQSAARPATTSGSRPAPAIKGKAGARDVLAETDQAATLAATCGFPSRAVAETALLIAEPAHDAEAAAKVLQRANTTLRAVMEAHPTLSCADALWAITPSREAAYLIAYPLSQEQRAAGDSGPKMLLRSLGELCAQISDLLAFEAEEASTVPSVGAAPVKIAERTYKAMPSAGISRLMVREALDTHRFDSDQAALWIRGVGAMLSRQSQLNLESREEAEAIFAAVGRDPNRAVTLVEELSTMVADGADALPRVGRSDAKAFLLLIAQANEIEDSEGRLALAGTCLRGLSQLLGDSTALLSIGIIASPPTAEDRTYICEHLHRFCGKSIEPLRPSTASLSRSSSGVSSVSVLDTISEKRSGLAALDINNHIEPAKTDAAIQPAMIYMRKVNEVLRHIATFPELEPPSREQAARALDECHFDERAAGRALREELRKARDAELRLQYKVRRNSEAYKKGLTVEVKDLIAIAAANQRSESKSTLDCAEAGSPSARRTWADNAAPAIVRSPGKGARAIVRA